MADATGKTRSGRVWAVGILAVAALLAAWLLLRQRPIESGAIPYFSIPVGKVRPALPYRIVSFHRGRADKNLIKLASQLGFNGVQIQIEGTTPGSNEGGIRDFAARDASEHLIDYCHSLGMKVTVWVHELDLPPARSPDYAGEVTADNKKVWDILEKRYQWMLTEGIPNVDGLVLTVVESPVNATPTPVMLKLVDLIDRKCREHGKSLIVRTFVWRPDELDSVMAAVRKMPEDITMMSKIVVQDWQMRGDYGLELGAVGGRPQIVEFDAAGEYFLKNNVANCMVDLLHRQFDYAMTMGAQGICVRVDRDDSSLLFEPAEANLWALGMLAAGATSDDDEIWRRWAEYRFGKKAAPGVIAALKPSGSVVAEMLSVGPFTLGDTRNYPPQPNEDILGLNWQNWKWNVVKYSEVHTKVEAGDAGFIEQMRKDKEAALAVAEQSLQDLEAVKSSLTEQDYRILQTRLLSNKVQLQFRTIVALAALHFRQAKAVNTVPEYNAAAAAFKKDIADARALALSLHQYPVAQTIQYMGKAWAVDYPLSITPEQINGWATPAETKVQGP